MTALLLPEELTAPATDVQVGEVRAYMVPHVADPDAYRWGRKARAFTPVRCHVVATDPVTVTFTSTRMVDGSTRQWRDIDGEAFTGHSIPPGVLVILGASESRLACLWADLEDWHDQRLAREAAGSDRTQLIAKAERVRDGQQLMPVGDPTVVVDAAALLALCRELGELRDEVQELRADAHRVQELLLEAEAEERAAIAQAERDGLVA